MVVPVIEVSAAPSTVAVPFAGPAPATRTRIGAIDGSHPETVAATGVVPVSGIRSPIAAGVFAKHGYHAITYGWLVGEVVRLGHHHRASPSASACAAWHGLSHVLRSAAMPSAAARRAASGVPPSIAAISAYGRPARW